MSAAQHWSGAAGGASGGVEASGGAAWVEATGSGAVPASSSSSSAVVSSSLGSPLSSSSSSSSSAVVSSSFGSPLSSSSSSASPRSFSVPVGVAVTSAAVAASLAAAVWWYGRDLPPHLRYRPGTMSGWVAGLLESHARRRRSRRPVRVYMDGCFDLMHYGHANALRQARALGDQLVVGLIPDSEILRCKGPPVLREAERLSLVEGVKWVDEVIRGVPYDLTPAFLDELFSRHRIDYVIHGDDPCLLPDGTDAYAHAKRLGRFRVIKRTEGVSTTELVGRMLMCTRDARRQADGEGGLAMSLTRDFSVGSAAKGDALTRVAEALGKDRPAEAATATATGSDPAGPGSPTRGHRHPPPLSAFSSPPAGAQGILAPRNDGDDGDGEPRFGSRAEADDALPAGAERGLEGGASPAASPGRRRRAASSAPIGIPGAGGAEGGEGGAPPAGGASSPPAGRALTPVSALSSALSDAAGRGLGAGAEVSVSSSPAAVAAPPPPRPSSAPADRVRVSRFMPTSRRIVQFSSGRAPPPGGRVAYVDGAFDLFHPGHVEALRAARSACDFLLVGVHADADVSARRGRHEPLLDVHERALSVLACRFADEVIIGAPLVVTEDLLTSFNVALVLRGTVHETQSAEDALRKKKKTTTTKTNDQAQRGETGTGTDAGAAAGAQVASLRSASSTVPATYLPSAHMVPEVMANGAAPPPPSAPAPSGALLLETGPEDLSPLDRERYAVPLARGAMLRFRSPCALRAESIIDRILDNRARYEARNKKKVASETNYYEKDKVFVQEL